jgi:hypothetical protein
MSKATDVVNAAANAVDENDPKLDELSLEELKELAAGEQPKPEVKEDKPAKQAENIADPDPANDDEDEVEEYEYKIDLGDGSGIQIFKGNSVEEVMNKLGEAQKHATRKIREQAEQLKKYSAQAAKEAADNEYVYGQELITKPTEAFKKLFKETTGVDIESFANGWERVKALETAQAAQTLENKKQTAATAFLAAHPEFIPNPANGKRLEKAVNLLIAEANSKNQEPDFNAILDAAYADLSESGLLELKDPQGKQEDNIADKSSKNDSQVVAVVAHTRRASGLTARARTVTTPRNAQPTEAELYAMPLDQLRELSRTPRE